MNRLRVFLTGMVLAAGLSVPAFAADVVQGTIESIDAANSSILVKDPVDGAARTVRVHPKVLPGIKNGSVVKAALKPGTDTAETLEVLSAE